MSVSIILSQIGFLLFDILFKVFDLSSKNDLNNTFPFIMLLLVKKAKICDEASNSFGISVLCFVLTIIPKNLSGLVSID